MDWSTENLGDLYKIGSSKRVLKSQWQTSGVPFYRGREITVLSKHGEVSNELFISEELYQEYAKKHGVPATEDIVITAIGTIGNSYIVGANDRFYFKDASVLWLKKTSNVDSSFINLWLKSPLMREQLDEGNGATVDTLTIKKLQTLQVNLPPIPEQQRIVAILDQAFADIEKARANAEKNLKNARELFDSYLNQVFSQRGEGWVDHDLKDIVILKSGTTVKKELERTSGDVAYIKVSGMNLLGNEIEITTSTTFLNHGDINANNVLPLGTTIFPKRGGAIATNKKRITAIPLCIDLNTMGVIPMQGVVLPLYVYFYFKTFDLLSISNGTTIPQINNYSFDGLKVSIPDIEVQKTSIKMMTQIQASTDELSLFYETKLKFLDELKKSLLQKAFSGELTKGEGRAA
jgi:type I restriction enzyme S subunit